MSQTTISREKIPETLYKYRPMNKWTKDIIRSGRIYFTTLAELNDPFEYMFTFKKSNGDHIEQTNPFQLTQEQRALSYIRTNGNGEFCLSAARNSIYMYCHYADSFKGI